MLKAKIFFMVGVVLLLLGGGSGIALFFRAISGATTRESEGATGVLWGLFLLGIVAGLILIGMTAD